MGKKGKKRSKNVRDRMGKKTLLMMIQDAESELTKLGSALREDRRGCYAFLRYKDVSSEEALKIANRFPYNYVKKYNVTSLSKTKIMKEPELFQVYVAHDNHPENRLTDDQLNYIKEHIQKNSTRLLESEESLLDIELNNGYLVCIFSDIESTLCISRIRPIVYEIKEINTEKIRLIVKPDLHFCERITGYFPYQNLNFDEIKVSLSKQNLNLEISKWKMVEMVTQGSGTLVSVDVPIKILDVLKKVNFEVRYRDCGVTFRPKIN